MEEDIEVTLAQLRAQSPFPLSIPVDLAGWMPEFEWSRDALLALDLPVESMPATDLEWQLDLPWWRTDGTGYFQLRPTEMLQHPRRYDEHRVRVERCDVTAPLHIFRRSNRWVVLDGMHRLLKAHQMGLPEVRVMIVSPSQLVEIAVTQ